ncbi:MAG: cell division topological specificity factor MinE [Syntrophomonadaceae bacterium]|nr:cell division topological specificity factor MinE [Syntrophomonadaceae bacterium]
MLEFLAKLFWRDRDRRGSKEVAKERLRLVLVHDRTSTTPQLLEALKEELIKVIREYIEIDEESLEVSFNNIENSVALVANIQVLRVKKDLA